MRATFSLAILFSIIALFVTQCNATVGVSCNAGCSGSEECVKGLCACSAGYHYLSGSTCTACGAGTYKSAIGDAAESCVSAPSGWYAVDSSNNALSSPYTGAVGISQAGTGNYVVDSSGSATNSGGVRQAACPVGRYAGTAGMSECVQCAAGTYQGSTG